MRRSMARSGIDCTSLRGTPLCADAAEIENPRIKATISFCTCSIYGISLEFDLTAGLSGVSFSASVLRGREIHALKKAMAAAADNHAPGMARLPVSWIR